MSMNQRLARVSEIIDAHGSQPSQLIAILQDTQSAFNYLSQEDMTLIAHRLGISTAKVYSVATFYENFSLEPKGAYVIGVCTGTACYVKGAQAVLEKVENELNIPTGKTTKDGKFTIQATRCLGCCGLAPVMTINDDVYGRLKPEDIPGILAKYKA